MGGNALSRPSTRLARKDYERVAGECLAMLTTAFPGTRSHAIESYRAKADFGDLDILVESVGYNPYHAARELGAVETVRNGPVTSIGLLLTGDHAGREVPGGPGNSMFQVDLISTDPEAFDFACCYFKANDTGNLLGRVAHAMGMSLRSDGLVYHFRDGDYKFRTIMLTRDFSQALRCMGYVPEQFHDGFEDHEDIFRYVSSSPFFNRDIFLLENRNAMSRIRDRKRPTYNAFLKWCEGSGGAGPGEGDSAERTALTSFEYPKDKAAWLPHIMAHFPAFEAEYKQAIADMAAQRAVKERFSGAVVRDMTGLEGKELGVLMTRVKESFESTQTMQAFMLEASREEIEARVRACMDARAQEIDAGPARTDNPTGPALDGHAQERPRQT